MDKKALEAFAREAAKSIKTESDLDDFRKMLTKVTVETALNAELDEHLGYQKHQPRTSSNSRNGYSGKSIITDDGKVDIDVPRDREASFEPQLVRKHQTRFQSM
ncbi:transposase, partial [Vibrio parahaemolyticus]|nr:transposase [Vibrio parahaemolyticus]